MPRARHARTRTRAHTIELVVAIVVLGALALTGFALGGHSPRHDPAADAPPARRPPRLPNLATPVHAYLAHRAGHTLVAVEDLQWKHVWILGSGPPQDDASIVKLDILETLLATTPNASAGLSPTLASLATGMIEYSDNDDATALFNRVGGAKGLRHYNNRVGLAHTTPSAYWGLTTSTPDDQLDLLRHVVDANHLLTKSERRFALGLMEHVVSYERWGVTAGVPPTATVALKNGWLPLVGNGDWQINSIGWVSGARRDYLIAVMSTGNPTEDYGIATIEGVSKLISPRMAGIR